MGQPAQASLFPAKQPSAQGPWLLLSGWEWVALGDVCDVNIGGTPSRNRPEYWGPGHTWVSIADLNGDVVTDSEEQITDLGVACSNVKEVESGTVLMSFKLTIGKMGIAGKRLYTNEAIAALLPKSTWRSRIISNFLFHALRTVPLSSEADLAVKGKTLNKGKLARILVPIPFPHDPTRSLDIQRHIVTQIETLLAEVKEARALAAAIRRDTDRIMGAALEEVISEIPTSRRPLLEVLEGKPRNGWSPQCDNDPTGTPVLKLGAVLGFRFNPSAVKRTSLPVDSRAHYWLTKGDILISRSNTPDLVGHAAICSGEPYPCIYPDLLVKMRARPTEANPQFVVYWLQCKEARAYVQAHASGASSTMKKITQGDVCFLPFPKVGIEEQRRVVAHLDVVQNEIDEMRRLQAQDAELLDQLEQSILERAFRGEL